MRLPMLISAEIILALFLVSFPTITSCSGVVKENSQLDATLFF